MSNNASLTPVKDLKPFKTKWRSQVKVLHSWLQNTGFGGETLQMVLTDEQVRLPLGKWRVLTMFSVSQASGQYRPTSHPYKITISDKTVISNSDLIEDSIFLCEDIIDGTLKTNFLIDVMGKIVSLEPVQTVQVEGQDRKKVQFRLLDANGKDLACCLWGKYAEKMEACVEREQPLICLIRVLIGEVQITNAFDASIVYLDPTMEKALQFKEKLVEDGLPLAIIEKKNGKKEIVLQEDDWNKVEIKMISELFVSNQVANIVPSNFNQPMMISNFGVVRSAKLKSMKFKLHLIVRDDTETCKLLLLNTVAKTIVGHEAVDLWDGSYDEIEDPELLPEQVRALEGKSFCFGISVKSDNVRDGAATFRVLEVWSGDHILKVESQSEPTSMIGTSSSTVSSGEVLMLEGNSQNDSEECKTPFAKRKEEYADLPDITSTSKKLCTSIKVEKEKEE
uniref:Replication protein A 70 kDa DNA-binding subunit B/D first OB fold domain-containing protein n=1 Tax=Brassica oleracea var. oleracea TaxID=109376 RepID=A0A0D3AJ25_BRAOL